MARAAYKLSDTTLRRTTMTPGLYSDGASLYVRVSPTGNKSFVFVYVRNGRRRELGLGGYPATPLALAREHAQSARETLAAGDDPIAMKRREDPPLLGDACETYCKAFEGSVTARRAAFWRGVIKRHLGKLAKVRVDKVTTSDVAAVLRPLQDRVPTAAKELRSLLERTLDYCRVLGQRDGENPARWSGNLKLILASLGKPVEHHPSLPYASASKFYKNLLTKDTNVARSLAFIILTASRLNEVRFMVWSEVDLEAKVWTVPAARMKTRTEHRVPLSTEALRLLEVMRKANPNAGSVDFVFPGRERERPVGHSSYSYLVPGCSVHGFRATFKVWTAETTDYADHLTERCLGHKVGTDVQRAYQRSDLLEKRAAVMQDWSDYLAA